MFNQSSKVGYKQPPKSGQWKKGQSGNPSGKKKQPPKAPQQPLLECFVEQLKKPVEMTAGGEKVSVPLGTAFVTKLLHEAMSAPIQQKLATLALFEKLGILSLHKMILETEPGDGVDNEARLSEVDLRTLEAILEISQKYKDEKD